MKCISLWQPWATLWVSGIKIHETRHWPTKVRETIAVHAAKRPMDAETRDYFDGLRELLTDKAALPSFDALPFGAIVGVVDLVDCCFAEAVHPDFEIDPDNGLDYFLGDFGLGRFAWRGANHYKFEVPIPYRGCQGFFEIPDDIITDGPIPKPEDA